MGNNWQNKSWKLYFPKPLCSGQSKKTWEELVYGIPLIIWNMFVVIIICLLFMEKWKVFHCNSCFIFPIKMKNEKHTLYLVFWFVFWFVKLVNERQNLKSRRKGHQTKRNWQCFKFPFDEKNVKPVQYLNLVFQLTKKTKWQKQCSKSTKKNNDEISIVKYDISMDKIEGLLECFMQIEK